MIDAALKIKDTQVRTLEERVRTLRSIVEKIDKRGDDTWTHSLEERKKDEAVFHDEREDRQLTPEEFSKRNDKVNKNKKYYNYTQPSRQYLNDWLREHVNDKVFLDYACGDGQHTVKAAQYGAALSIGIDISNTSVQTARKHAQSHGVAQEAVFFQGDCENTGLPDNSVDIILCCGMLHHLDLSAAYPELARILAPNGRILAYEALNYNPLIKLYRRLTPELRTAWESEHILSLRDVTYAENFFEIGAIRYWNLFSIFSPHLPFLAKPFALIDKVVTRIPGVQLLSWIFTFELLKKK
jgi:ubiquinone/menaquinone biosynthesis C-methylase UbiE